MFRRHKLDVSSACHLVETAPAHTGSHVPRHAGGESNVPGQPTAQPARHGPLGRLRNFVARTSEAFTTSRIEVSTALSTHGTLGRASGPEHHIDGELRFPPQRQPADTGGDVEAFASASPPLADVIARTSLTAMQPDTGGTASATSAAILTRADLVDWTTQQFTCGVETGFEPRMLAARLYDISLPATEASRAARSSSTPSGMIDDLPTPAAQTLAASRAALLARALRQTGIDDSDVANVTLEYVGLLDFSTPHLRRSYNAAEQRAWRVVRLLMRSGEGREVLAGLRGALQSPYDDERHRRAVEVLLTSCEALDPDAADLDPAGAPDCAPGAVAARRDVLTSSPLTAAEPGADALAKRAFNAAATLLREGSDAMTADQKGAFFAWRQWFRGDGLHSDLSRARRRLARFTGTTIPRVTERRWRSLLPRMVRGSHASPLSALRYGTQGVPRTTIEKERAILRDGLLTALHPLMQSPALQPAAALGHARPAASLAEIAALQIWLERGGFPAGPLDAATLRAIAIRAHRLCSPGQPSTVNAQDPLAAISPRTLARVQRTTARWQTLTPDQLAGSRPFRSLARRPFTLERLAAWGKIAALPATSPFWTNLDTLRRLTHATAPRPTDNLDDVRDTLLDVVGGLQSGQRLSLSDGGRQGISTRGVNETLRVVTHGHAIPVSPRVDLRATRTREAVVEVSRSTQGAELFVGTAETRSHYVGGGLLVGYDIDTALTTVRAGIVTNAILHARDLSEPSGLSIRFARRPLPDGSGYDDRTMQTKMGGLVDHLFDEATHPRDDGPEDVWNRLAERYWDDPDVSISWTDSLARSVRRGFTLDASGTARFGNFGGDTAPDPHTGKSASELSMRTGPSAGGGWERRGQTVDSVETTGRTQIEQHRLGIGSGWTLRGGISPGFSHPLDPGGSTTIGLLSIDAPAATLGFAERNRSAKLQLVREDGRLVHRACLLDIEHLDARTYTRALDDARPELVALFAAQIDAQRAERQTSPGRHAVQKPADELAAQRIDRHLAAVRKNQRPHLTYTQRYRLRHASAIALDANEARLAQAGDDPPLKAEIEADNAKILDNPASWMAIELKVKERNTTTHSFGPNLLLQLTTRTSAVGDREIMTEAVPFDVLEALDG